MRDNRLNIPGFKKTECYILQGNAIQYRSYFFVCVLITGFLVCGFISCQKELDDNTVTTPVDTTVTNFSLAGAPDGCENAVVTGTFIAGIPTPPANNVLLNVNVSVAGDYTIHTDTVNGIYFSASGVFSATGLQQIRLDASGTPSSSGNFTFTPSAGNEACSFGLTVVESLTLADYMLISGTGNPGPCSYSVTGNFVVNKPLSTTNNVTVAIDVAETGNFTIATNAVNGITFSASGDLITLGRQVITLFGTGTPLNKGTFGFTPEIMGTQQQNGNACTFDVTVE